MVSPSRRLVDTNAAAVAVNRPASTVRRWAHEGRITRKGTDRKGRALYDLTAVYKAQRDTERR